MEKTKTRAYFEALVKDGVSPQTAKQAASTMRCDDYFDKRTERGSNKVLDAWEESMLNAK
jgi:hypothetical protein